MDKNIFIKSQEAAIARLNKQRNSLSPDDQAIIDEAIAEINDVIAAAQADESEKTALETLQAAIDTINSKIEALAEKTEQEPEQNENNMGNNYLASKEAIHDFCNAMRSRSTEEMMSKWNESLQKNGISYTSPTTEGSFLLPETVKSRIETLWNADTNWLTKLNNSKAKQMLIRYSVQEQSDTYVRAAGHTPGNTKIDQDVKFSSYTITPMMVYKKLPVDNKTIFFDDGALVDWVTKELVSQIIYEIHHQVLVGDDHSGNDVITSFTPIAAASSTDFVTVSTNTTASIVEDVVTALESISGSEDVILFTSKGRLNEMRRFVYATGGAPVYKSVEEIAEMIGVSAIYTTDLCAGTTAGDPMVIAFQPSKYALVGTAMDVSFVQYEDYDNNVQKFRAETMVGGGPAAPAMGICINVAEP